LGGVSISYLIFLLGTRGKVATDKELARLERKEDYLEENDRDFVLLISYLCTG
jgi:hypothetical protein